MTQIHTTIRVAADSPAGRLRLGDSAGQWDAAVGHRFVDELFAGTIDDAVLAGYLVQDYQFFDAFLSMLGGCVAHADRLDSKLRFAAQLGMLATDEDGYFQQAFTQLGVTEDDWRNSQLSRAAAGFQAEMYDAVAQAEYADLLVMLVIAEWLYLDWGERDAPLPERYVHSEWIELHRGEAFSSWCQFLVDELNRVWPAAEAAGRVEELTAR
ncbi:TenA family protein [Brevibacterium luteolum]|uniref:TenA family protein n=1 Tax=Brevibacterium luteolum TaxID=199591 RepID=UPI00223C271D|nr:TenA family protein [Brevibacterium luteolum]MCT1828721.1 TenA family protein [Brevibacterium luteolum]